MHARPPLPARPARHESRLAPWIEREKSWARWLNAAAAYPSVLLLLAAVSRLGDGVLWYGLIAGLFWWGGARGPECAVHLFILGLVNLQIYAAIKTFFARPRPFVSCPGVRACVHSLDEFSFPSGHTMHAVAFSMVIAVYYPPLASLLWSFTLLVALSRVVLGLHYPSDVAMGALLGGMMAKLSLLLV